MESEHKVQTKSKLRPPIILHPEMEVIVSDPDSTPERSTPVKAETLLTSSSSSVSSVSSDEVSPKSNETKSPARWKAFMKHVGKVIWRRKYRIMLLCFVLLLDFVVSISLRSMYRDLGYVFDTLLSTVTACSLLTVFFDRGFLAVTLERQNAEEKAKKSPASKKTEDTESETRQSRRRVYHDTPPELSEVSVSEQITENIAIPHPTNEQHRYELYQKGFSSSSSGSPKIITEVADVHREASLKSESLCSISTTTSSSLDPFTDPGMTLPKEGWTIEQQSISSGSSQGTVTTSAGSDISEVEVNGHVTPNGASPVEPYEVPKKFR